MLWRFLIPEVVSSTEPQIVLRALAAFGGEGSNRTYPHAGARVSVQKVRYRCAHLREVARCRNPLDHSLNDQNHAAALRVWRDSYHSASGARWHLASLLSRSSLATPFAAVQGTPDGNRSRHSSCSCHSHLSALFALRCGVVSQALRERVFVPWPLGWRASHSSSPSTAQTAWFNMTAGYTEVCHDDAEFPTSRAP